MIKRSSPDIDMLSPEDISNVRNTADSLGFR